MAKKKAAVKKVGTGKSLQPPAVVDVDAGLIEYPYGTKPTADLPYNSTAFVTVGSFKNTTNSILVTSSGPPVAQFGFVVEDYEVPVGFPPEVIDFVFRETSTNPKQGTLNLIGYPRTGMKLKVTILTRKTPQGGQLAKSKGTKKTKTKVATKTKKK